MQLELLLPEPLAPAVPAASPERPSGATLADFLATTLQRPVRLTLTDNRTALLSYREQGQVLHVRLKRALAGAGEREREALVRFLRGKSKGVVQVLEAFLEGHEDKREPREPCRPLGRFHDLTAITTELNLRFFHGASRARITWGTAAARRWRRSIQLGCYVAAEELIRIHPALDQ